MYVKIGETTYRRISDLSFCPKTNVTGRSLPINEFTVDIYTDDTIDYGATCQLYDDLDQLWAEYECTYKEKLYGGWTRILAKCWLYHLDDITMDPEVYEGVTLGDVVEELAGRVLHTITVDPELAAIELNGYVPEQTARERLTNLAFVAGGYIKSYNSPDVQLLKIDDEATLIPRGEVVWRPTVEHTDPVAWLHLESYDVIEQTPQQGQQSVEVDGRTFVLFHTPVELSNPDAPFEFESNGIQINDLAIINADNADDIMANMAKYAFPAYKAEGECVNNRQYEPGKRVTLPVWEDAAVSGYVERCDFAFGLRAMSKLYLTACQDVAMGALTVLFLWGSTRLGKQVYSFPVGYSYSVRTRAIDQHMNSHRYVFYPSVGDVYGVMPAGEKTETVPYNVALDQHKKVLEIRIVDSVEVVEEKDGDQTIRVAVFA